MGQLGMGELLVILVIVMLVFGAGRLPQIGEGLGKAVRNLKRGLSTDDDIEVTGAAPKDKEPHQVSARSTAGESVRDARDVSDAEVVERKS